MSVALLCLLLAAAPQESGGGETPAATSGEQDRLELVRKRRAALEAELQGLRGEERSLLGEVEGLELELRLRSDELLLLQLELKKTRAELDAKVARVQKLEASLASARPALAAHARALYRLGEVGYLRLLLSIDHPADFFRAYRLIATLARRDNARVAAFRSDLVALQREKTALEQRTRDSIALRTRLSAARRGLDQQRERKTRMLTSLVEKKELNAAYVEELSQAEARLQELIQGLGGASISVPVAALRGSLPWPAPGRLRAGFGRRKHARFDTYTVHNGIEIDTPAETPVRAVHEGRVVFADRFRGYGLMVIVDHGDKHHSLYAQLQDLAVGLGQDVSAGAVVGTSGPGGEESPGVYFEMRYQGHAEDPLLWLSGH